jgi:hypothetical protein
MAKQSAPRGKSGKSRQNANDAFGNFAPQAPMLPDSQVMPVPIAALKPVVQPPSSDAQVPPLVP